MNQTHQITLLSDKKESNENIGDGFAIPEMTKTPEQILAPDELLGSNSTDVGFSFSAAVQQTCRGLMMISEAQNQLVRFLSGEIPISRISNPYSLKTIKQTFAAVCKNGLWYRAGEAIPVVRSLSLVLLNRGVESGDVIERSKHFVDFGNHLILGYSLYALLNGTYLEHYSDLNALAKRLRFSKEGLNLSSAVCEGASTETIEALTAVLPPKISIPLTQIADLSMVPPHHLMEAAIRINIGNRWIAKVQEAIYSVAWTRSRAWSIEQQAETSGASIHRSYLSPYEIVAKALFTYRPESDLWLRYHINNRFKTHLADVYRRMAKSVHLVPSSSFSDPDDQDPIDPCYRDHLWMDSNENPVFDEVCCEKLIELSRNVLDENLLSILGKEIEGDRPDHKDDRNVYQAHLRSAKTINQKFSEARRGWVAV